MQHTGGEAGESADLSGVEIEIAKYVGVRMAFGAGFMGAGIAYVPEDRRRHGVILEMPVAENATMAIHERLFPAGWLRANLVDRVRKAITVNKCLTDEGLAVHRTWHELGGRSTATMMFGHVETLAERIEHLERVRQLQDETGGFTAFICWTHQPPEAPPCGACSPSSPVWRRRSSSSVAPRS